MKKVLLLLLTTITFGATAQLEGQISYTTTVNLHKMFGDSERGKRMKEFIPETTSVENELLFTTEETLYKNIPEDESEIVTVGSEDPGQGRGARMMHFMKKRMAPPNDVVYCDVENGLIVEKKEFMDKNFLIKDTLNLSTWKLTGEQKEVSGMMCMKAEYIPADGDTNVVIAWFTPEIPVSSGPAGYGGLPGLILHLDKNEGQVVISVSNIVMREIEKKEIDEPKKGKVVTQEEYDEIVMKKMEEQRKNWSGDGGRHGGHR